MHRFLPIVLLVLAIASPTSGSAAGDVLLLPGVKMTVLRKDGKQVISKVVNYSILEINGKWEVIWNEVKFFESGKNVSPILEHFSSLEGSIKNVRVWKDHASFDIESEPGFSILVTCRPWNQYTSYAKGMTGYTYGAEECVVTDRTMLPSTEGTGSPTPGEKPLR